MVDIEFCRTLIKLAEIKGWFDNNSIVLLFEVLDELQEARKIINDMDAAISDMQGELGYRGKGG